MKVRLFKVMDLATLERFFIAPITSQECPLASQDDMVEVYQTNTEISFNRSSIVDIAFIVSLQEVESGMFYISGAENTFFIRYIVDSNGVTPFAPAFYFSRHFIEPLNIRLFIMLNSLSQNIRKVLYHLPESESTKKSFKLPLFSTEVFWYLVYKLTGHRIGLTKRRNQRIVKYFNTLQMELHVCETRLSYIQILTQQSLSAMRKVLGAGVGLGVASKRPTKSNPRCSCTIGGILTSIECEQEVPYNIIVKPDSPYHLNGIDFIFYEVQRSLSCIIRFSKIVVKDGFVVTSRLPSAVVAAPETGIYVNALFVYNNQVLEVVAIYNTLVRCAYVEEAQNNTIDLPIDVVRELVSAFGYGSND